MKAKRIFMAALGALMLASCADDGFVGDQEGLKEGLEKPIGFGFDVRGATKAGGSAAATALSNQFIVWGEKGEAATGALYSADDDGANTHQLVFNNYLVNYTSNTAYTTTSNTKDWEYVGYKYDDGTATIPTTSYSTNITPNSGDNVQTIKYWDYSASNYVFTAVSALPADIRNGRVQIAKTTSATTGNLVYDKGYTITLTKTAGSPDVYPSLDNLYVSDREVIAQSASSDREAKDAYGGYVELTFRKLMAQVRVGIYETIEGYGIKEIKFYVTDGYLGGSTDGELDLTPSHTFGAICPNTPVSSNFEGTLKVTYYNSGTLKNQANVTVTSGSAAATDLILGNNFNTLETTTPTLLGTSSNAPTWDTSGGAYTKVLPQVDNDQSLRLKVDYTLWNSVTGETIEVHGATATIPSQYLQWKSNYNYTYLFKISNNTNGFTNPALGPAGLYPITLDAVEIENDDNNVEFITIVSEPSITTYAKASAVVTDNEYASGNNIYAVVEDNGTNPALTVGTNAKLYYVTLESGAELGINEQSVDNAITNIAMNATDKTYTVTDAAGKKMVVTDTEASLLTAITQIPAADSPSGADLTINGVVFKPAAKYVVVPDGTALTEGVTYYTSNEGAGAAVAGAAETSDGTKYRKVCDATGAYVVAYQKPAIPAVLYEAGDAEVIASTVNEGDVKIPAVSATWYYKVIKVVTP